MSWRTVYRRPFTMQDAYRDGKTHACLRYGVSTGALQRIGRGVYMTGGDPPAPLEVAIGRLVATDGVATGTLAGILHGLDSVQLREPYVATTNGRRSCLGG